MARRAIDRRVARTRATLQHALISLIPKKGYEAVTVEDICDAANVGRSTFYAHYTGKDDLKRRGLDEHLRALLAPRQKRRWRRRAMSRTAALASAFYCSSTHEIIWNSIVPWPGAVAAKSVSAASARSCRIWCVPN
ncbi:MAG: TetR family transcriptional regulator [Hyphomicrobiales bacterium]|nr:MAG: TetR family transcriptional regulator [Hyphomicrobiales bacterium]